MLKVSLQTHLNHFHFPLASHAMVDIREKFSFKIWRKWKKKSLL